MFKEKILEIVKYNLIVNEEAKTKEEKKENDKREGEELYKKTDDAEFFIDKLFEEEYEITNTKEDVIKTFLENMGVDEKNSKNMSEYFLYSYNPNLRILSRELNNNFYLIAFMDMSRDYQNNKDKLEYILSNFLGYNITEKDSTRNNNININAKIKALFYISENRYTETAKLLIENGADVNQKYYRATPLMFASENGHYKTVKLLIDNKADINAEDNIKRTALFNVVWKYQNTIDSSDKTQPSESKLENYLDIANLLVEKGADILITDNLRYTLLMFVSVFKEFNKITEKIIEKADINYINKEDYDKCPALILAVKASNFEILKLLKETKSDIYDSALENALIYSVEKDDTEIIKYFIEEENIDIEQKYENRTLLDYAFVYGNIETIKYLLSKGGKLHYKDNTETSLMLVSESAKRKTVEYIIDYTKENLKLDIKDYINYKNENGQTALVHANFNELNKPKNEDDIKEVVNLLKGYGAS